MDLLACISPRDRLRSTRRRCIWQPPPPEIPSLVSICRHAVATHLKEYPPDSFAICDVDEWEEILFLRSRRVPPDRWMRVSVSEIVPRSLLQAMETANPHLEASSYVDQTLWQGYVERTFPKHGTARPRELYLPWPELVERLRNQWASVPPDNEPPLHLLEEEDPLQVLYSTSWNVALVRDTGLDQTVQLAMQRWAPGPPRDALQKMLEAWRALETKDDARRNRIYVPPTETRKGSVVHRASDVRRAERCQTWKQLFQQLQERQTHAVRMRRRPAAPWRRLPSVPVRRRTATSLKASTGSDRRSTLRRNVRKRYNEV